MKALSIETNGVYKCIAGDEDGSVVATISAGSGPDISQLLAVFGKPAGSEETAFWLLQALFVDDEVVIRLVEVNTVDAPIELT